MFGASIGRGARRIIDAMVRGLARGHVNPNWLTVIGVSINVLSGLLFGYGYFFSAGLVLIVANLFDMLDGSVARMTGRVTRFGGFLDSSLDRLSDMVVFVGLMIFYARVADDPASPAFGQHSTLNVFLAGAALMGSVLVSYTSARAESLIPKCDVGFLRRPERVVLLIIGALSTHTNSANYFANRMPAVLWVLAVGSYWTFAHRMYHTWREVLRTDALAQATDATNVLNAGTGRATAGAKAAVETMKATTDASKSDDARHAPPKVVSEPHATH